MGALEILFQQYKETPISASFLPMEQFEFHFSCKKGVDGR
jgi:hypothetical protein